MSIHAQYWGKEMWHSFYAIAFGYPETGASEEQKLALLQYFQSLTILLPCEQCRSDYIELVKLYPIAVETREAIVQWVYKIQTETNKKIQNAPSLRPLDEIKNEFETYRNSNTANRSTTTRHIIMKPAPRIISYPTVNQNRSIDTKATEVKAIVNAQQAIRRSGGCCGR